MHAALHATERWSMFECQSYVTRLVTVGYCLVLDLGGIRE